MGKRSQTILRAASPNALRISSLVNSKQFNPMRHLGRIGDEIPVHAIFNLFAGISAPIGHDWQFHRHRLQRSVGTSVPIGRHDEDLEAAEKRVDVFVSANQENIIESRFLRFIQQAIPVIDAPIVGTAYNGQRCLRQLGRQDLHHVDYEFEPLLRHYSAACPNGKVRVEVPREHRARWWERNEPRRQRDPVGNDGNLSVIAAQRLRRDPLRIFGDEAIQPAKIPLGVQADPVPEKACLVQFVEEHRPGTNVNQPDITHRQDLRQGQFHFWMRIPEADISNIELVCPT